MKTAISPRNAGDMLIHTKGAVLKGDLMIPADAHGVVLFAHGSGSGRLSPRNRFVASVLREHQIGTLLFDLLTLEEERADALTAHLRFDIPLLAARLAEATEWLRENEGEIPLGYFGASTGAAAALIAAAHFGEVIKAVVSRGGRPDLAGRSLREVVSPTLLIVGGLDGPVITLNSQALDELPCEKRMEIVPGATHLFEESGTLEKAAGLAAEWFSEKLSAAS